VKYYPAFLNLCGKNAVVVGGGRVAERKVLTLVETGAIVKVISPAITNNLKRLKEKGLIRHTARNYRKGDAKNAFIVFAATSSAQTNTEISKEAKYLVNVVDKPERCNFIVPSIVRRGALTIAISTGGTSPAAAKAIRKEIERLYGAEFSHYLKLLGAIRKKAINKIKNVRERERFLKWIASDKIFHMLRKDGFVPVSKLIEEKLKVILIQQPS